jgi:hypothetical protein
MPWLDVLQAIAPGCAGRGDEQVVEVEIHLL